MQEATPKENMTIKPLVRCEGGFVEHRPLNNDEIKNYDWTWYKSEWFYFGKDRIDMEKLAVIADIKVVYPYCERKFPSVEEVLQQIPKEYVNITRYFYEVYSVTSKISNKIFKKELDNGYMVSIVRLYKDREEGEIPATQYRGIYPEELANVPAGISEAKFQLLKKELKKLYR